MVNLITGLAAILMIIVFLGFYAIKINSAPLWVIILAVLAMVVTEFVQSVKNRSNRTRDQA